MKARILHSFIILVMLLMGSPEDIFAQIDSSLSPKIGEVEIKGKRLEAFAGGKHVHSIDSQQMEVFESSDLSELLKNEGLLFVKSYGNGSLASLALRGSGAAHTAVIWNGFNLQSPMNGNFDLSLVPLSLVDEVKVQYGGNAALYGQGNLGGAIHLDNKAAYNEGLSAGIFTEIADFQSRRSAFNITRSKEKSVTTLRYFNSFSENNFSFHNLAKANHPKEKQKNADLTNHGLLFGQSLKINKKQELDLNFWYQNTHRHIPPSMTQSASLAYQNDEFYRTSLNWTLYEEKKSLSIRAAYFKEFINYCDPQISLDDESRSESFITEIEGKYQLKPWFLLDLGVHYDFNTALVDAYNIEPQRNSIALFGSGKIRAFKEKLLLSTSFRQAWTEGLDARFLPAAGLEYKLFSWFKLKGHTATFYRVPTFNDLYWNPGGNPDLKPESGYGFEAGFEINKKLKKHHFKYETALYYNLTDDWILWLPGTNQIWSPVNINKVESKGLENHLSYTFVLGDLRLVLRANYQYTSSINKETGDQNAEAKNKQLIYVPEHITGSGIVIKYKRFDVYYNHSYTGKRFILADNSDHMEAFHTGNLRVATDLKIKKLGVKLYAGVNNITDEEYQSIQWRPMPGRNYYAGIKVNFKK